MDVAVRSELRRLEGSVVGLALRDGSRVDGALLVSAGRGGTGTVWVFAAGADVFVPIGDVRAVWETEAGHGSQQRRARRVA